jgi:multiple sugar transport system substrate-binding protein
MTGKRNFKVFRSRTTKANTCGACFPLRFKRDRATLVAALLVVLASCGQNDRQRAPHLKWYVFDEPSGAFDEAAKRCSAAAQGAFWIETAALPASADQQREQLVRRLAAGDNDIDVIGMDVIWTAEFAEAGWILPWSGEMAEFATRGRLAPTVQSALYEGRLWAVPFTSNTQLLWYRTDRVTAAPDTWYEMIRQAEALGEKGTIQLQGERYEGLTVFFVSLLSSAGGTVLDETGQAVSLEARPTRQALDIMHRLARSSATDPMLSTSREDEARLAFEAGDSSFMINYTFVWPSAQNNASEVADNMGWARWPSVKQGRPSRVAVGGINLGISAHSRYPELAFRAALCIASGDNQRLAAARGGLPPTIEVLYDDPRVREVFPFANLLRETLRDGIQRPQSPMYNDISLAISRTLHPMRNIDPEADVARLREVIGRALRSEGLL